MNGKHPMGVLHSFSIKNIFHDIMDLRLFYFHVTIYICQQLKETLIWVNDTEVLLKILLSFSFTFL